MNDQAEPRLPGTEAFAGALYADPPLSYARKSKLAGDLSGTFDVAFSTAMIYVERDEKGCKLALLDASLEADGFPPSPLTAEQMDEILQNRGLIE